MNEEQVLEHLLKTFGGQLVLYPNDIAKILNKSQKAIQQLIARGGLPFSVKSVGGRRCVDVYQVARWLATEVGSTDDLGASPKGGTTSQVRGKPLPGSGSTGRGAIGRKLMDKRYQDAVAIFQMASTWGTSEEAKFLLEVADAIARTVYQVGGGYTVSCNQNLQMEDGSVSESLQRTFGDAEALKSFLVNFQKDARQVIAGRIVVRRGRKCIFHSFSLGNDRWTVLVNDLPFEYAP